MKHGKNIEISTVEDVRAFFRHLVNDHKLNFHPDTPFEEYVKAEGEEAR